MPDLVAEAPTQKNSSRASATSSLVSGADAARPRRTEVTTLATEPTESAGDNARVGGATFASRGTGVPRRVAPTDYRVSGLSTWTGRVTEVDGDVFTAELIPDQHTRGAAALADFPVDIISAGDETLRPGDVIYVTVRSTKPAHGGLARQTSSVRLRRLGKWTASDVARFRAAGQELSESVTDILG